MVNGEDQNNLSEILKGLSEFLKLNICIIFLQQQNKSNRKKTHTCIFKLYNTGWIERGCGAFALVFSVVFVDFFFLKYLITPKYVLEL